MKELPPCPMETTLMIIGDKWKALIIRELLPGTRRVLTQKLREMESDGLLERKVYAEVPPKVEYMLTELGMMLRPVLESLEAWGMEYKAAVLR